MNNTKQLFNGIWTKINKLLDNKEKKNLQLLEPLSTIIRLCILYFDIDGTKIAIYNNRIFNQEPNFMQGTLRWTYGNKRNELHYLYRPIIIATQKYNIENNKDVETIFKFAIKGLDKLKQTYIKNSGTIICHSIDLYKDALEKALKNKKINNEEIKNIINCDDLTNKLYDDFFKLWDKEQIKLISDLILKAEKTNDKLDKLSFIKAIDAILNNKERKSLELIKKTTENITS